MRLRGKRDERDGWITRGREEERERMENNCRRLVCSTHTAVWLSSLFLGALGLSGAHCFVKPFESA